MEVLPQLADILEYEDFLKSQGLRESTIALYSITIANFLMVDPDIYEIDSYNQYIVDHSIKRRSNYFYDALKNYIKFKVKDQGLKVRLIRNLVKPKIRDPSKRTVYLDSRKRKHVIDNLESKKHQVVAMLQNELGVRVGDVLRLPRDSISFENYQGKVTMRVDFEGKGGFKSPMWVFDKEVQDDVMEFIGSQFLDDEYYFIDRSKAKKDSGFDAVMRTNYHWYWRDLKKALVKIGLSKNEWATHDFRRSVARDVYEDPEIGRDVQLLQRFLHHKRPETTMRYLRTSGLDNIQILEKLNSRKK
jgi:integrase